MDHLESYIFDMDGTLLDSSYIWKDVFVRYMKMKGRNTNNIQKDTCTNMSLTQTAIFLQKQYGIQDEIQKIIYDINTFVKQQYIQEVQLKDGVFDCIWNLKNRNKMLYILTACDKQLAFAALKRCNIATAFSSIMTCETLGYAKTEIKLYEKAVQEIDKTRTTCVFIEDSFHAIQTIKEAGYTVFAVFDEVHKNEWKTICKYSDKAYINLCEMEIE